MSRPHKQTVDYFPHYADASDGDTLTVLQGQFGNDGYAFWFKLLEKLAASEGHFIDCRNSRKWQVILARARLDEETGAKIMTLLVEMGAIDNELWTRQIIWCQKLVDNIAEAYKNRRSQVPQKPVSTGSNCATCGASLKNMRANAKYCSDKCRQTSHRVTDKCDTKTCKNGITTSNNAITTPENPITTPENPHTKLNETKLNNTITLVFNHWNQQNIIVHKKLTDDVRSVIVRTLRSYSVEEVQSAISNYAEIVNGDEYYFRYKWTLKEFLKRGMEKFTDLEVARSNFRRDEHGKGKDRRLPKTYTPTPDYPDL